jgi:hypothetical protein
MGDVNVSLQLWDVDGTAISGKMLETNGLKVVCLLRSGPGEPQAPDGPFGLLVVSIGQLRQLRDKCYYIIC